MTASHNIKTPAMDVPLLRGPQAKQCGEKLRRMFTKVYLNQVRGHRHYVHVSPWMAEEVSSLLSESMLVFPILFDTLFKMAGGLQNHNKPNNDRTSQLELTSAAS